MFYFQAAEKSLKATKYAVDAEGPETEHNLCLLAETMSDNTVDNLTEELENLLGGKNTSIALYNYGVSSKFRTYFL